MSRGLIQGYCVTSTLTAPDSTATFSTLARVHTALRIGTDTSNDDFFNMYLPIVTGAISDYCNRVFAYGTYQDLVRPGKGMAYSGISTLLDPINLRYWPLGTVLSLIETIAGTAQPALVQGTDFEVRAETAQLYRLDSYGNPRDWTAESIAIQYQAGYVLPTQAPVAGMPSLPLALEQAAITLLTMYWRAAGRDPALKQESVADISDAQYWVGQIGNGELPPQVETLVARYREPVFG